MHITPANVHDVNAMDMLIYETGAWHIFDRAYLDYERLNRIRLCSAYFVIWAKSNFKLSRIYSAKVDWTTREGCNQIGKLTGTKSTKAQEMAMLYKQRWQVELFFKWVKQHLKIKSFWGTSENTVRI